MRIVKYSDQRSDTRVFAFQAEEIRRRQQGKEQLGFAAVATIWRNIISIANGAIDVILTKTIFCSD
jgi:hypothetical protein